MVVSRGLASGRFCVGPNMWGLIMDRVNHAVNEYIDNHVSLSLLKPVALYLWASSWLHPISVGASILVLCVLVLVIHAYVETRPKKQKLSSDLALPDRIRNFSKELAGYVSGRTPRPDEDEIWQKYGSSSSATSSPEMFATKYTETIQLWDDQLAAGYWKDYADRAGELRHELVLRRGADLELDRPLNDLQKAPAGQHHLSMRKLIERFRLLASQLD